MRPTWMIDPNLPEHAFNVLASPPKRRKGVMRWITRFWSRLFSTRSSAG